jgi:hypothetical protein
MDRRTVYILTGISPNSGGRVQEVNVGEQFELESLELFDPVAQEKTGFHPTAIIKGNQSNSREPRPGLNLHGTETRYS